MKFIVAVILVIFGMGGIFASVRAIARFIIGAALLGAIILACYIISEEDLAWGWTVLLSLLAGAVGGIVCIPILPYAGLDFLIEKEDSGSSDKGEWKEIWEGILEFFGVLKKKLIAWATGKKSED